MMKAWPGREGGRGGVNGLVAGLLTSFPAITNCGVCMLFIIARFQGVVGSMVRREVLVRDMVPLQYLITLYMANSVVVL